MIKIFTGILGIVFISYLEPVIYVPFAISVFLLCGFILYSNRLHMINIVFLILISLILDITLKLNTGNYMLALCGYIFILEVSKTFASEGTPLFYTFKLIGVYFSTTLLSIFYFGGFSNSIYFDAIIPTIASFVILIMLEKSLSIFNQKDNLSFIKL